MTEPETVYIYRWDRMGRKGQRCVVEVRGAMNSCVVRFEDGVRAVTSRNALKRADTNLERVPSFLKTRV